MLKVTPLEFETFAPPHAFARCYSLKFTPLEFETRNCESRPPRKARLKFTPLEFETSLGRARDTEFRVKIYSVGV